MGFKMVKGEVAIAANSVRFGPLDLAMHVPQQQRPMNESRRQYFCQSMDSIPDKHCRLVGWAYAETQRGVRSRPSFRCILSKRWFLREAGFYLDDGRFLLTPLPQDTV